MRIVFRIPAEGLLVIRVFGNAQVVHPGSDVLIVHQAKELIAAIEAPETGLIGVRLARAYVAEKAGELMQALRDYDGILASSPDRTDALRGKDLLLRSLLLPDQTLELPISIYGGG